MRLPFNYNHTRTYRRLTLFSKQTAFSHNKNLSNLKIKPVGIVTAIQVNTIQLNHPLMMTKC